MKGASQSLTNMFREVYGDNVIKTEYMRVGLQET